MRVILQSVAASLLICLVASVGSTFAADDRPTEPKRVRMIYLVSRDREEKPEYTAAIEHAIRDLQKWYAKQLGGPTFRLHEPVVEVVKSNRNADWFYGNPNGANKDNWGFNNTLGEARELVSARHGDPQFVWIVYSDGPGNKGRGGGGVAVLPEDDLLGLVGRHPTQKDKLRWIAGLGHELGHALGLPHPKDTKKHANALMWTGIYGRYPDRAYLTPDDKKILMRSPFFYQENGDPVVKKGPVVAQYGYNGGAFEQHESDEPVQWTERKSDGTASYSFEETRRTTDEIYLKDARRGISIKLPVNGGRCFFSTNDGNTWVPLYDVTKRPGD